MADERVVRASKIVDPTTTSQQAGVDASGNLQIIAASNTGVDIGDVDVLSVVPGSAATNLGKAEDVASAGGDVGVASMAVQDAVLASLGSIDGDYTHLRTDANGALWTHDDALDAALAGSELQVDVVAALPTGANVIGNVGLEAGTNNIGDVDVLSVVPGSAATNLGKAEDAPSAGGDVGVSVLAVRDDALGGLTPIAGDYTPLLVDANGALWTHDDALDAALAGSELQVDVVAALPTGANVIGQVGLEAGTNNIGDVDVLSVIPGTAAGNLGKAEDVASAGGDTGVAAMAIQDAALTALGSIDGDYTHLRVNANGALHVTGGGGGSEFNEDAASSGGELGALSLGYRQDADTSPVTADGDFHGLIFDANGALKVNVKTGGSEPTPTNPTTDTDSSTATAAGSAADLDSAEITEAEKLWQVEVSASVPFKFQVKLVEDGTPRNVSNLLFGGAGETIIWKPPHRDFAAHAGAAGGLDVFRASVTNMDTSEAADLHAAFHYAT